MYVESLFLALYIQADLSSVYTTLTTCPVTSLVTSGGTSFEETTTTISTVTRTSTSTLCTKCVAPPSKPAVSSSSPGETAVLATSGASSTLQFPGYGIVPSPTSATGSLREELFVNPTSTIPVYTAALLGNAYGGGFVSTPSVYVTKLPYPNGPSSGVPPGYGSESSIAIIENNVTAMVNSPSSVVPPGLISGSNVTAVVTGLEASSTSGVGLQSTTKTGLPESTATIASNLLSGSAAKTSENESSTPTFISLSPFGGEVGQESSSAAVPTVISIEVPSSLGSIVLGIEANVVPSATVSGQTGNSESSGANIITALVAGTSPAGASSPEVTQARNAVLSSLAAAGLSTSLVNVQVAVVGPSTPSGQTAESSFPTSTLIGSVAIPSTVITLSPTFSSSGVNIEATPSENGAIIIPSLPAEQTAEPVVTLAIGSTAEQTSTAGQPVASTPAPILIANNSTALAVVPSPVVGVNGLTSLAVFSTPIAPAAGLTNPAVLLTPIVGPNGLTSLAVVATPVVGANGLTSLAIGFETETTPAAGQSNGAPTPIEGFVIVQSPAVTPQISGTIPTQALQVSGFIPNQGLQVSGVIPNQALQVSGTVPTGVNIAGSGFPESPVSGGSGSGNYSIHVLLNPTAAAQFRGSAVRLTVGFGVGLFGLVVFLVLL